MLLAALLSIQIAAAQEDPVKNGLNAITIDAIKAQTGFLASDWTEGREAGEKGDFLAGDYIASMLQLYGIKPGGDYKRSTEAGKPPVKTYFQNFELLKILPGDNPSLEVISLISGGYIRKELTYGTDFSVRQGYSNIEVEAPVVFVGSGIRNSKTRYDDLSNKDIKGKLVLRIAGIPEQLRNKLTPGEISASVSESDAYIRSKGALGIIEIEPDRLTAGPAEAREFTNMSPSEGRPVTGRPRARYMLPGAGASDDFARITLSKSAGADILRSLGYNAGKFMENPGTGNLEIDGAEKNVMLHLKYNVNKSHITVRNILGYIEGEKKDEVIVVGAHYDHMGMGNGYVWNGADDNASGTVGVLMLARAAAAAGQKPSKTIVFALWAAEEVGLLGSRYFVRNPVTPLEDIKLNINFDMISRYISDEQTRNVTMTYTSSYPVFREITEKALSDYAIELDVSYQPSDDPPGGTDHRSFVEMKIPVIRFKPGHREEYHTPFDEVETLDWDIMEKIIRINFVNLWNLANSGW